MGLKAEKSSCIFNFRAMPAGFVLALAMVLAFETCIGMLPEHALFAPPYEQAALTLKGETVDAPSSFDVLVIGDCTGWAAIQPLALESQLQMTAYNLAVNGAQTYLMSYVLLKRYLSNCTQKPRLVILQLSANALFYIWGLGAEALNNHILPWFRMDEDFLRELSEPLQSLCNKRRILQLVPSLKNQFFLKKGFWPAHIARSSKEDFERYVAYYTVQKGFYNEDLDPSKKPVGPVVDIGEHFKQLSLSDLNVAYMHKIIALLLLHDIKVVLCLTPVRADEMQIWERYNLRARLNAKIQALFGGYPNVIAFWDLQDVAAEHKYFADASHVNGSGAALYSAELAKRLKALVPSQAEGSS